MTTQPSTKAESLQTAAGSGIQNPISRGTIKLKMREAKGMENKLLIKFHKENNTKPQL